MGSSQKTNYLSLNKWISTDIPKRADFNSDNELIDNAMKAHSEDMNLHISNEERNLWNSQYFIGFYYGDGSASRTVDTGCGFNPSFAIMFAGNSTPGVSEFESSLHKNRFAFATKRASNTGFELSGSKLVISTPLLSTDEAVEYNRLGGIYCYILFR